MSPRPALRPLAAPPPNPSLRPLAAPPPTSSTHHAHSGTINSCASRGEAAANSGNVASDNCTAYRGVGTPAATEAAVAATTMPATGVSPAGVADVRVATNSSSSSVRTAPIPPRARSEAGTGGSTDDANAVLIQELLRAIEGWRHADEYNAPLSLHREREEVQRECLEFQEMCSELSSVSERAQAARGVYETAAADATIVLDRQHEELCELRVELAEARGESRRPDPGDAQLFARDVVREVRGAPRDAARGRRGTAGDESGASHVRSLDIGRAPQALWK